MKRSATSEVIHRSKTGDWTIWKITHLSRPAYLVVLHDHENGTLDHYYPGRTSNGGFAIDPAIPDDLRDVIRNEMHGIAMRGGV